LKQCTVICGKRDEVWSRAAGLAAGPRLYAGKSCDADPVVRAPIFEFESAEKYTVIAIAGDPFGTLDKALVLRRLKAGPVRKARIFNVILTCIALY
jgi:hypothetical protein